MLSVLTDLALPSRCVSCADARGPVCARCRRELSRPRRHRPDPAPAGLPPLAVAGPYAGAARACLLAYKERGRRDLAGVLAAALAAAVLELLGGERQPVWLVPVPSAARVARLRGGQHVQRLAAGAAGILGRAGVPAAVVPALRLSSGRPDSAALGAAERGVMSAGKFTADLHRSPAPRAPVVCAARVLIVDDLVTTGSTIADAARALRAVGLRVGGAAAVAGTQRWDSACRAGPRRPPFELSHRRPEVLSSSTPGLGVEAAESG